MFTFDELKKQLGWKQKLAISVYWIRRQMMFGILTGWMTKAGAIAGFLTAIATLLTSVAVVLNAASTGDWAAAGAAWPAVLAAFGAFGLVSLTMQSIGTARKVERLATGELKQEVIAAESTAGKSAAGKR